MKQFLFAALAAFILSTVAHAQYFPQTDTYTTANTLAASGTIKAGAGALYSISGFNSKGTAQYIQIFDQSAALANGNAVLASFLVPATSNFSFVFATPLRFTNTIKWSNSSTLETRTVGSADCLVYAQYQ